MTVTVAALMQLRPDNRGRTPPDADFGRAARLLIDRGIRILVAAPDGVDIGPGDVVARGWRPTSDGWAESGPHRLAAVFNRLPARHPERWRGLLAALAARHVPVGNPAEINALALDKARSLTQLAGVGLPVPEVETDPARFAACLTRWGAAFAKPRYGSFGDGVRRLEAGRCGGEGGEELRGGAGELVLQRAVPPPPGPWTGLCVRGFLQRAADGAWRSAGRVARVSAADPVANVARGARAVPLEELAPQLPGGPELAARLDRLERRVVVAVEGWAGEGAGRVLELGVDWVLGPDGAPQLVEINGKPGGRLRALAGRAGEGGGRWRSRHEAALMAPFQRLAALAARAG